MNVFDDLKYNYKCINCEQHLKEINFTNFFSCNCKLPSTLYLDNTLTILLNEKEIEIVFYYGDSQILMIGRKSNPHHYQYEIILQIKDFDYTQLTKEKLNNLKNSIILK